MSKTIPNAILTSFFGKSWQAVARNDAGEPIFEEGQPNKPQLVDANAYLVLRELLLQLDSNQAFRQVHKPMDGVRSLRLWNQIEENPAAETLTIHDKEYEWLQGVWARQVPLNREAKDNGMEPQTVAFYMFSQSDFWIIEQLKDVTERKTLEQLMAAAA